MQVEVQLRTVNAQVPTKAHASDAGWDLYSIENVTIPPNETCKIRTGISISVPDGYYSQLHDRSSMGSKSIKTMGGVIDSTFTGEILVMLHNLSKFPFTVEEGNKVCQLVILPVPKVKMVVVDKLRESERNEKGFGSSGK